MSDRPRAGLRRLPLKVAGVIGIFSAALYLAVILGQTDSSQTASAVFWLVLIAAAGLLTWLADDSPTHGRRMAMGAAGLYFILGIFASTAFMVVFLAGMILTILGFAGVSREEDDA